MRLRRGVAVSSVVLAAASGGMAIGKAEPGSSAFGEVVWTVETGSVRGRGDVADDPVIWADQSDPSNSRVIGTNKDRSTGGLHVYDLSGRELQYLPSGRMNNVDLRTGFALGDETIDLVAATDRTTNSIDFFRVTAERLLQPVGSLRARIAVYGSCMYRSSDGAFHAFATSKSGVVKQFELVAKGSAVGGRVVRSFDVGGQTEGCVADDELGALYLSEEDRGVWRYGANPDAGTARTAVDTTDSGHLVPDVEGATILETSATAGYLVVSSQGNSTFAVYDRAGDNPHVGSFQIAGPDGDVVTKTDGIDAASIPLGEAFRAGLLAVHDATDEGPTSNYKLVSWESVAAALGLVPVETPVGTADTLAPSQPVTSRGERALELPAIDVSAVSTKVLEAP